MAGKWHIFTHEVQQAQYAVLEQGDVLVGKTWISNPVYSQVIAAGGLGPVEVGGNNGVVLDSLPWLGDAPAWTEGPAKIDVQAIANAVIAAIPPADLAEVDTDEVAAAVVDAIQAQFNKP